MITLTVPRITPSSSTTSLHSLLHSTAYIRVSSSLITSIRDSMRSEQIFDEFGIFLPPVPPKKAFDDRFYYYFELCRSVHHFAVQHGIPGELAPVFLYGFAPLALELDDALPANLPPPRRAWFVGGGINQNGDFEYLDQVTESSQTIWQGNRDTQPGDIVVMYCLSPRSAVHSFWRALRFGAVEPFRYSL